MNARAKGTLFETAIVAHLAEHDIDSVRIALHGANDKGDIHLHTRPAIVLEAKNTAKLNATQFVDEAVTEAANANKPFGVAIWKRPRRNVRDALVMTDLATFTRMVQQLEAGNRAIECLETLSIHSGVLVDA